MELLDNEMPHFGDVEKPIHGDYRVVEVAGKRTKTIRYAVQRYTIRKLFWITMSSEWEGVAEYSSIEDVTFFSNVSNAEKFMIKLVQKEEDNDIKVIKHKL